MSEILIRGNIKRFFEYNGQALLQITDGQRAQCLHLSLEMAKQLETLKSVGALAAAESQEGESAFFRSHRVFKISQTEREGKIPRFDLISLEECRCENCWDDSQLPAPTQTTRPMADWY
jgi:hypothetical protein